MNNLPIIDKLTVYDRDALSYFAYCAECHYADNCCRCVSFYNITRETAAKAEIKSEYTGTDAAIIYWQIKFDILTEKQRNIIIAVFPNVLKADKTQILSPETLYKNALKRIRHTFGHKCPRCGGSGSYSRSVAYTAIDGGVCHLCNGAGRALPRLTDKKIAEIASYFNNCISKSEADK